MTCVDCQWVSREPPVRGMVMYRCRNPEGRLHDPRSGRSTASTYGRVVDRPIREDWDPWKANIGVPAWCPRLKKERR